MERSGLVQVVAILALCLAGGALYHLQVRSGFAPAETALDLGRPDSFVLTGSSAVGPSPLGLLGWSGEAPLHLRLAGLGPPGRLRLKLLPECPPGAPDPVLALRVDGRAVGRIELASSWTLYELEPPVAGDTLTLDFEPASAGCPLHLSAVRTTVVERRSSGFPRYWIVRTGADEPVGGATPMPFLIAILLAGTAAGAGKLTRGGLGGWLRLVAPGIVALVVVTAVVRAAGLRLVYPPASYPVFLLVPGLLFVAWRLLAKELARGRGSADRSGLATAVAAARRRLAERPALVLAVLALLVWTWILTSVALERFGGDLRGMVHFGTRLDTADRFSGVEPVGPFGYDGQFYAVLATDPWLTDPATLERIDTPAYRATRILVPALAWTLALGRPDAALWAYLGLCWLLALGVVPLASAWLEGEGKSGWWAALLIPNAGLVAIMTRVTPDGAALFFLLLALFAHRRGRTTGAVIATTAAALTREVFLLGGVAMAMVDLGRRRWSAAAIQATLPAGALMLWRARVAAAAPGTELARGVVFDPPLAWIPQKLARLSELAVTNSALHRTEILCLAAVAMALGSAVALAHPIRREAAGLTLTGIALLALFFSYAVFEEPYGYARVMFALPVLVLLVPGNRPVRTTTLWWSRATAFAWAVAGASLLATIG